MTRKTGSTVVFVQPPGFTMARIYGTSSPFYLELNNVIVSFKTNCHLRSESLEPKGGLQNMFHYTDNFTQICRTEVLTGFRHPLQNRQWYNCKAANWYGRGEATKCPEYTEYNRSGHFLVDITQATGK